MNAVIQRVNHSKVEVDQQLIGEISRGLLILLGVAKDDTESQADYLINKITNLRVFEDDKGKMNLSALDIQGEMLVVSQFTLQGNCDKGRRPSFDNAADPEKGERLYNYFVEELKKTDLNVQTGQFRAMMDVHLVNDGPVTFILESK